ncbi:MAG TPA: hypothetical protein VK797_06940 [Tepidisphaeraceae bacterium]|nr:hypothetical protein [Tepidisphaeraceae bacterium]
MSVGFDPVAFGLALLVAVLAIIAFRQRAVILRILHVDCSATQNLTGNQEKTDWEFRVVIRNLGISLHNVRLCIVFRPRGMDGSAAIPLYRYSPLTNALLADKDAEFAHGMVGDFRLRTHWLGRPEVDLLAALTDPIAQQARLCVYTDGCYLAKQWKIGVGLDNARRRWNEMTNRLNPLFNSGARTKGAKTPLPKPRSVLRPVPSLYAAALHFCAMTRELQKTSGAGARNAQPPITLFTADEGIRSQPSIH